MLRQELLYKRKRAGKRKASLNHRLFGRLLAKGEIGDKNGLGGFDSCDRDPGRFVNLLHGVCWLEFASGGYSHRGAILGIQNQSDPNHPAGVKVVVIEGIDLFAGNEEFDRLFGIIQFGGVCCWFAWSGLLRDRSRGEILSDNSYRAPP